jgi:hypothetical protein
MKYTVYKVINQINGKEYIGKHQTDNPNDDYLGSGKNLRRAIEKHGRCNFEKEILHIFDTEEEMNAKESELVTEEYISRKDTYNLCPGGHGGFGYVNNSKEKSNWNRNVSKSVKERYGQHFYSTIAKNRFAQMTEEEYRAFCDQTGEHLKKCRCDWTDKKHSEKTKQQMSDIQRTVDRFGKSNPTFGMCWIKNPQTRECGRIYKSDLSVWLSKGWLIGKYQKDVKYVKFTDL